ncbi:hypothetical protein Rs2_34781 [Raphanus sativus]|uniref:FCS-Like Zinc finger 6 n=1 Tax=Raphanus sativus TaxID=3726 RepID=A0A6J0K764_RAPSA|nr:FCS-Like Zinc finger 6 [Raphanus sativus]KAJ4884688.1 hypothetical protein Rs2_34781 [Raphanus sativus]
MLLGKRRRPPINRTTSLSEIKFDLNLPGESEVSSTQQSPSQNPMVEPYVSNGQLVAAAVDRRLLAMVSPRGNLRRHSVDFSDAGHFLRSCSLCERLLVPGRDIYMYRGDTAFCSLDCRQQQIAQDERNDKSKQAKESTLATTSKAAKGGRASTAM